MLGENVENRMAKYVRPRKYVRDWRATEKKEVDMRAHTAESETAVSARG